MTPPIPRPVLQPPHGREAIPATGAKRPYRNGSRGTHDAAPPSIDRAGRVAGGETARAEGPYGAEPGGAGRAHPLQQVRLAPLSFGRQAPAQARGGGTVPTGRRRSREHTGAVGGGRRTRSPGPARRGAPWQAALLAAAVAPGVRARAVRRGHRGGRRRGPVRAPGVRARGPAADLGAALPRRLLPGRVARRLLLRPGRPDPQRGHRPGLCGTAALLAVLRHRLVGGADAHPSRPGGVGAGGRERPHRELSGGRHDGDQQSDAAGDFAPGCGGLRGGGRGGGVHGPGGGRAAGRPGLSRRPARPVQGNRRPKAREGGGNGRHLLP
ncbi:putative Transcriptional regulator, MerR family [Streptomyces misionensis JCM 4497]